MVFCDGCGWVWSAVMAIASGSGSGACISACLVSQAPRVVQALEECKLKTWLQDPGSTRRVFSETVQLMYSDEQHAQFMDLKKQRKHQKHIKERIARARTSKGGIPSRPTWDRVLEKAALGHFRATLSSDSVYSLSCRNLVEVPELMPLNEKRSKTGLAYRLEPESAMFMDGDDETEAIEGDIFFSVVRKTYSRVRVIHVPALAAHKLGPDDIGIAIHSHIGSEESPFVHAQPSRLASSPIVVLSRLGADVAAAPSPLFQKWQADATFSYILEGHVADDVTIETVTKMVHAKAFAESGQLFSLPNAADRLRLLPCLQRLEASGCAEAAGDGRGHWCFTPLGQRRIRALQKLHSPGPALALRAAPTPLANRTQYELVHHLQAEGWTWKQRPSSRTDHLNQIRSSIVGVGVPVAWRPGPAPVFLMGLGRAVVVAVYGELGTG